MLQLWQGMVERDFPYLAIIENDPSLEGEWKQVWQRLKIKRFNPLQTHPSITLSPDCAIGNCSILPQTNNQHNNTRLQPLTATLNDTL